MYKNKEIGDFAKSFLDNKRLAGEKLRIPKDDNPDEWGKIYSALGRPEKPDGYKQPELELPEGVEFQWINPVNVSIATIEISVKNQPEILIP